MNNTLITVLFFYAAAVQAVDMSSMFRSLAGEMSAISDGAGKTAVYLTNGQYQEYLALDGGDVWIDNGRYVVFESSRPRPVGGTTSGERQLMAADTQTGALYWIRALTRETTETYGSAHIEIPADFHYDCCEAANLLAFRDITGHRLYCLNLNTGSVNEIWTLTDGTFSGSPVIAKDGSWVMITALLRAPDAGGAFAGTTAVLCKVPINPATGAKTANPVCLYDRVSIAADSAINTFRGASVNKYSGEAIVWDIQTDGAYSTTNMLGLRYVENDTSLISKMLTFSDGVVISNLFWGSHSRYIYYIESSDTQTNLTRMHTVSRRYQKWKPTLAAKRIRLTPDYKDAGIGGIAKAQIECFDISDDENTAVLAEKSDSISRIDMAAGTRKTLLGLSSQLDIDSLAMNAAADKSALRVIAGGNARIAVLNID